jgi:hypothetical protein
MAEKSKMSGFKSVPSGEDKKPELLTTSCVITTTTVTSVLLIRP